MDENVQIGTAFEAALREAVAKPDLWVPGIGNGALGAVLKELNCLPDDQVVALVRKAVASAGAPQKRE